MKKSVLLSLVLASSIAPPALRAQQPAPEEAEGLPGAVASDPGAPPRFVPGTAVPRLIKVSGLLRNRLGDPLTGSLGVSFALYEEQEGGTALWMEAQNVEANAEGRYSVLLGATKAEGLPLELFAEGMARWLGVEVPGQPEPPRILLLSVPYALKAEDADKLGGRPASDFVRADQLPALQSATTGRVAGRVLSSEEGATSASTEASTESACDPTLGHACIDKSNVFQSSPGVIVPQVLGPVDTASADSGAHSNPLDLVASVFNSETGAATGQRFRWQADPLGNNTASPSGRLSLLFSTGDATPAATGLSINPDGTVNFVPSQSLNLSGSLTMLGPSSFSAPTTMQSDSADSPALALRGLGTQTASLLELQRADGSPFLSFQEGLPGLFLSDRGSGDYSPEIRFATRGSYANGPWITTVANAHTGDHDHVFHHLYNVRWNDAAKTWERIVDGEHGVRVGYESRFVYAHDDPAVKRGAFEFNIDLARNLSGAPHFDRRPLFLGYDMDHSRTAMSFGDSQDARSDYFAMGFAGAYGFVFAAGRGHPNLLIGSDPTRVTDMTRPNRIVISTRGIYAHDRAAYMTTTQGEGQGLRFEPGISTAGLRGEIYLGHSRPTAVNVGGFLVFGTGSSGARAVAQRGLIRLPNGGSVVARNAGQTGDVTLVSLDSSNRVVVGQDASPVRVPGPLETGALAVAGAVTSTLPDGQPPLVVASATPVANLTTAPATYTAAGAQQKNVHLVSGNAVLSGGSLQVNLSGPAQFSSATSYTCTATDTGGANPVQVSQQSGASFTLTGTAGAAVNFICIGN